MRDSHLLRRRLQQRLPYTQLPIICRRHLLRGPRTLIHFDSSNTPLAPPTATSLTFTTQYNNSQTVRGYPDISANGANYVVAVDGSLSLVYGTSASSPVVGSIITLINEQRIAAGKSVVGFINPVLYENPDALNDITSGGNEGCGTAGFTAVEGWDPVTGLGTPDYEKLLSVWLALS